jgi:peptidoglycan/LPS O-acetylase OafA/YrhL
MQVARLAVTAVIVVTSYRYIEKPMLRRKERFSSRVSPGPKAQTAQLAAQGEKMPLPS